MPLECIELNALGVSTQCPWSARLAGHLATCNRSARLAGPHGTLSTLSFRERESECSLSILSHEGSAGRARAALRSAEASGGGPRGGARSRTRMSVRSWERLEAPHRIERTRARELEILGGATRCMAPRGHWRFAALALRA